MYPSPIPDADRDRIIAQLQRSHASGHLDQDNVNRRIEVALATRDAAELHGLVADLPDLSASSWAPDARQQLVGYSKPVVPTASPRIGPPNTAQFLRGAGPMLAGIVGAMLALMIVGRVMFAPQGASMWGIFLIFVVVGPWMRYTRSRPHRQRPAPPPASPPRIADRYDSENGRGSQWYQPPADDAHRP